MKSEESSQEPSDPDRVENLNSEYSTLLTQKKKKGKRNWLETTALIFAASSCVNWLGMLTAIAECGNLLRYLPSTISAVLVVVFSIFAFKRRYFAYFGLIIIGVLWIIASPEYHQTELNASFLSIIAGIAGIAFLIRTRISAGNTTSK